MLKRPRGADSDTPSKRPREADSDYMVLVEVLTGDPFTTPRSVHSALELQLPVDIGRDTLQQEECSKRLSRKQLCVTLSATGELLVERMGPNVSYLQRSAAAALEPLDKDVSVSVGVTGAVVWLLDKQHPIWLQLQKQSPGQKRTPTRLRRLASGSPTLPSPSSLPPPRAAEDPPPYMASLPKSLRGVKLAPGWRAQDSLLVWEHLAPAPSASIAAFDFDGCLADTPLGGKDPSAWKMQYKHVPRVLSRLHERGSKIVIVTNESMDRLKKTEALQACLDKKCGRLEAFCKAVGVPIQVLCATAKDSFRKPDAGAWQWMVQNANGSVMPDLEASFFVGDAAGRGKDHSDSDLKFAKQVGIKFYTETEYFEKEAPAADFS